MTTPTLYDYSASPNCLKIRVLLGHLGIAYRRHAVDIFGGDTLTGVYAQINPARRVPVLQIDGHTLVESSAILWYLAEGTPYLPDGGAGRAHVIRWLLHEQGPMSEGIAAPRFRLATGRLAPGDPELSWRQDTGLTALQVLEDHLTDRAFLVDDTYGIADIACHAYAHVADEAGLPLASFPAVERWLARVERQPDFVNDLSAIPEGARLDRGLSIYG